MFWLIKKPDPNAPEPYEPPIELKPRYDAVMAKLHKQARLSRRVYKVVTAGYMAISVCALLNGIYLHWLRLHVPFLADLLPFLNIAGSIGFWCTWSSWQKTTREMAASADIRDIGAFIEALKMNGDVSRTTLVRLLPRLRVSDGALLQEHHRTILRNLVGSRFPRRFLVPVVAATLKAYEQIGDDEDIPVVESVVAGKGFGKYEQVRRAADECLPALRNSAEQHRQQVTLLRASAAGCAGDADLVRPVDTQNDGHSAEMLRASTGQG